MVNGAFRDRDVERAIEREIEFLKQKDPNYPVPSVDSLRHTYTPDAIIEAGDKVEIDRVDIEGEMSGLHHEHDVQRRLAYIEIVKPSGPTHLLKQPIVFTGASATWTGGYTKILEKINRRLCAHFGIESLHDPRVSEIAKRGALADAEAAQGHGIDGRLRRDAADAEAALLHAAVLARTDLDALLRRYARRTADRKDRMLVNARTNRSAQGWTQKRRQSTGESREDLATHSAEVGAGGTPSGSDRLERTHHWGNEEPRDHGISIAK
jgi:hypothetical protein